MTDIANQRIAEELKRLSFIKQNPPGGCLNKISWGFFVCSESRFQYLLYTYPKMFIKLISRLPGTFVKVNLTG